MVLSFDACCGKTAEGIETEHHIFYLVHWFIYHAGSTGKMEKRDAGALCRNMMQIAEEA
jgi:hypothetical protein